MPNLPPWLLEELAKNPITEKTILRRVKELGLDERHSAHILHAHLRLQGKS